MKKILPLFLLLFTFISLSFLSCPSFSFAAASDSAGLQTGDWYKDSEVTFVGKNAARSGELLDWTLQNYDWETVQAGTTNPLEPFWKTIVVIVFLLFGFFIIVSALIFIITRGKSVTIRRFIPRFVMVALFIVFSFAIVQTLYQVGDLIQGFFLKAPGGGLCPPDCIQQKHLLFVGWDYPSFEGLRRFGEEFAESGFITLLLTKLTALTYFVMVGILIVRKIILWFFVIVSPIFPILLLYYPLRNTAKIWTGEFFRWLLYGPLFAVFLAGLVSIWQQYIPIQYDSSLAISGTDHFPTGVNILLGGPGQIVSLTNNLNYRDTFAQYVVALIMLWIVIILPFILLQIFLDYMNKFAWSESSLYKKIVNTASSFNKPPPSGLPSPNSPLGPAGAGIARALPFGKRFSIPKSVGQEMQIPTMATNVSSIPTVQPAQVRSQVSQLANLSVPTMRDIARFETSLRSTNTQQRQEVVNLRSKLSQIANPASSQEFREIREKLLAESKSGNVYATTILSAANSTLKTSVTMVSQVQQFLSQVANPTAITSAVDRDRIVQLRDSLVKESQQGNQLATTILISAKNVSVSTESHDKKEEEVKKVADALAKEKSSGNPIAAKVSNEIAKEAQAEALTGFPVSNRVQQVSLDDYEAVKKMWNENYQKMDAPLSASGEQLSRKQWVEGDVNRIAETINLLTSQDQEKVKEGMQQVSDILPFLLIGGFSQTEIVAYLKAKQEAAKGVLEELSAKGEEEDTLLEAQKRRTQAQKTMTTSTSASIPDTQTVSVSKQNAVVGDISNSQQKVYSGKPTPNESIGKDSVLLKMANLVLPTLKDIARFDVSDNGNGRSRDADAKRLHEALKNIAHPASADTEKIYKNLRSRLIEESKGGNELAKLILVAAASTKIAPTVGIDQESLKIERLLLQLVNPMLIKDLDEQKTFDTLKAKLITEGQNKNQLALTILASATSIDNTQVSQVEHVLENISNTKNISSTEERKKFEELRQKLLSESQKGNLIAASVISVSQILTNNKLSEGDRLAVTHLLKEELSSEKSKGNQLAGVILDEVNKLEKKESETAQLVSMLKKIINPGVVTEDEERKRYEDLQQKLIAASKEGSQLAESILSSKNMLDGKVEERNVEDAKVLSSLHEQLISQTKKGEQFASTLLNELKGETENKKILAVNDLLRKLTDPKNIQLSTENKYLTNLKESLQFESQKDNPIAMSILSATQITKDIGSVSYEGRKVYDLINNPDASKNPVVSSMLSAIEFLLSSQNNLVQLEEVLVNIHNPEGVSDQNTKERYKELNTKLKENTRGKNPAAIEVSSVIDRLVVNADPEKKYELIVPLYQKLLDDKESGDVFASMMLNEVKRSLSDKEMSRLLDILRHIADPSNIPLEDEKVHYEQLRQELIKQKEQKNAFAATIITVADVISAKATSLSDFDKSTITNLLRENLSQEKERGNEIANAILTVSTDPSEKVTIENVHKQLMTEKEKGDPVAVMIVDALEASKKDSLLPRSLPNSNRVQQVNLDDYESVKNIWTENYKTREAPVGRKGNIITRKEWLESDIVEMNETMSLLTATDPKKVLQGMENVSGILPFLLIGGFSQTEIISYLKAKQEAAKSVLSTIDDKSDDSDLVKAKISSSQKLNTNKLKENQAVAGLSAPIEDSDINMSVLKSLNIPLPKLSDIARYDHAYLTRDRNSQDDAKKLEQTLSNILLPETLDSVEDREHYSAINAKLIAEQQKGDPIATAVLASANTLIKKINPILLFPEINKIQTVDSGEYEKINKLWVENYKTHSVPEGTHESWIANELVMIDKIIDCINSTNPRLTGQEVSSLTSLMPFFLIGGYTKSEVLSYFNAKKEAALYSQKL